MHSVARRYYGVGTAWALVVGALALSSFGVYLGRVPRVLHPERLPMPDRVRCHSDLPEQRRVHPGHPSPHAPQQPALQDSLTR